MKVKFLAIIITILFVLEVQAQDSLSMLATDEKPLIDLGEGGRGGFLSKVLNAKGQKLLADAGEANSRVKSLKKKSSKSKNKKTKEPKGMYMGLPIKKFFVKSQDRRSTTITVFHYLKEYREPNPWVDAKYYYDTEKKKIIAHFRVNKENALILHGPYERKVNGVVVEKGYYHIGTKHGRWEKYHKTGMLTYKEKFYKGFPKESIYKYHDTAKKRLKEIIPMKDGYKHGYYISFSPKGKVLFKGYFQDGQKIGRWTEYYLNGNRKQEIQYPKVSFTGEQSYVRREWNERKKLVIDNRKK